MKDFLHVSDLTADKIWNLIDSAKALKIKIKQENNFKPFNGKTLAMIFQKPSARTRVSFETGFYKLGVHALYLGPDDIGLGKRESTSDIAQVLSRFNDMILARVFSHQHIIELAEHASVPVINGLTDYNHPCQIMSDIMTISEHRKNLDNLKITYIGDGNNIVHSWLELAAKIPIHLVVCCPDGYYPNLELFNKVKDEELSMVEIIENPQTAVQNADIIYTDVWASMGQKEEASTRRNAFKPYQVNSELIKCAKNDVKFMHCLPAERGVEVTDNVCDAPYSIIFDQAENRMHMQNAIMLELFSK